MILTFQLFLLAVLMTYLSFENVSLGKTSQSQVTLSSVGNTKIGKTCHMLGFPLRLERGSCVGWKSWVLERMSDFWSRKLFHRDPVVEGASGQGRLEVRILWMSQIKNKEVLKKTVLVLVSIITSLLLAAYFGILFICKWYSKLFCFFWKVCLTRNNWFEFFT